MEEIIKKITRNQNPESIFLYGSKARGDDLIDSDTEIGVLSKEDSHNCFEGVFFFDYDNFKEAKIDTPFPLDIYLRELSLSAKTIYGEKVVENFTPPAITKESLLERINFDCATALYAAKFKNEELFYKSVLFGVRNIIILEKGVFPLTYKEIWKSSESLNLEKFNDLPQKAYETRETNNSPNLKDYKRAISLTNSFLRRRIKREQNNIILK